MNTKENILEAFQALQLGPAWTEPKPKSFESPSEADGSVLPPKAEKKRQKSFSQKRDDRRLAYSDNRRPSQIRLEQRKRIFSQAGTLPIEVFIRPQETAFKVLVKTLKSSRKTYQLFPLIRLFFEKDDRYFVIAKGKKNTPIEGFYCANELPFLTLESALDYLVYQKWDDFFTAETVTLERPHGNFQSVNRCGITQILLAPPNYHRYPDLLEEHYNHHVKRSCSYKTFLDSIKNEHSPEIVEEWLNQMTQGFRYHLKEDPNIVFDSREAAKKYLQQHIGENGLKFVSKLCLQEGALEKIVDIELKRIIQQVLKNEKRSPIDTANYFRGRLHHARLNVYKRGKSGQTYVCGIKRKIRNEDSQFPPHIQKIITLIEQTKDIKTNQLPYRFFEIDPAEINWETKVPPADVRQFKINLAWLIREGYVTEYEDNTLYISPVQHTSEKKNVNNSSIDPVDEAPTEEIPNEELAGVQEQEASEESQNLNQRQP